MHEQQRERWGEDSQATKRSRVMVALPSTTPLAHSEFPNALTAKLEGDARLREAIAARIRSETDRDAARLDAQQQTQRLVELGLQLELVCASEARLREQMVDLRVRNAEIHALRQRDACEARVALEQLRSTMAGEAAAQRTIYHSKLSELHEETARCDRTLTKEIAHLQANAAAATAAATPVRGDAAAAELQVARVEVGLLRVELEAAMQRLTQSAEVEQLNGALRAQLSSSSAEASRVKTLTLEVERFQVEVNTQFSLIAPNHLFSACSSAHSLSPRFVFSRDQPLPHLPCQGLRDSHSRGRYGAVGQAALRG